MAKQTVTIYDVREAGVLWLLYPESLMEIQM